MAEWMGGVPLWLLGDAEGAVAVPAALVVHDTQQSHEVLAQERELVLALQDAHGTQPNE